MNTINENQENQDIINNEAKTIVKVRVADHTGHTTLEQLIDDAVKTAMTHHHCNGQWAFVGSRMFQFESTGLDDVEGLLGDVLRLRKMLLESPEPIMVLTAELQGGQPAA